MYDDSQPTPKLGKTIPIIEDRRFTNLFKHVERVPTLTYVIFLILIEIIAFYSVNGGTLHPELEQYIPHYLSDRPILQKIYSADQVEIGSEYRPRPLSYLIDNYDVLFIGWCTGLGHPHFESLSYFVFWTIDCFLCWFCFRNYFGLDRLNTAMLIGLFCTSPVVFFSCSYFRSAKPGAVAGCSDLPLGHPLCFKPREDRASSFADAIAKVLNGGFQLDVLSTPISASR